MEPPAFVGGEQLALPIADEPQDWREIEGQYGVKIVVYRNGHVCCYYQPTTRSPRHNLSEKLVCLHTRDTSRRSILTMLKITVTQALLDLEEDYGESH